MAWQAPTMMPGQRPYTQEEWTRLQRLLGYAIAADVMEDSEDLAHLDPYERAMIEDQRRDERRRNGG